MFGGKDAFRQLGFHVAVPKRHDRLCDDGTGIKFGGDQCTGRNQAKLLRSEAP